MEQFSILRIGRPLALADGLGWALAGHLVSAHSGVIGEFETGVVVVKLTGN